MADPEVPPNAEPKPLSAAERTELRRDEQVEMQLAIKALHQDAMGDFKIMMEHIAQDEARLNPVKKENGTPYIESSQKGMQASDSEIPAKNGNVYPNTMSEERALDVEKKLVKALGNAPSSQSIAGTAALIQELEFASPHPTYAVDKGTSPPSPRKGR